MKLGHVPLETCVVASVTERPVLFRHGWPRAVLMRAAAFTERHGITAERIRKKAREHACSGRTSATHHKPRLGINENVTRSRGLTSCIPAAATSTNLSLTVLVCFCVSWCYTYLIRTNPFKFKSSLFVFGQRKCTNNSNTKGKATEMKAKERNVTHLTVSTLGRFGNRHPGHGSLSSQFKTRWRRWLG